MLERTVVSSGVKRVRSIGEVVGQFMDVVGF